MPYLLALPDGSWRKSAIPPADRCPFFYVRLPGRSETAGQVLYEIS